MTKRVIPPKYYNLRKYPKKGDKPSNHFHPETVSFSWKQGEVTSEEEIQEQIEIINKVKELDSFNCCLRVEEEFYLSFLKNRGYPYEYHLYDHDGNVVNDVNLSSDKGVFKSAWNLTTLLNKKFNGPNDKGVSIAAKGLMEVQLARQFMEDGSYKAAAGTVAQLPRISRSLFTVIYEIQIKAGRSRTSEGNLVKKETKDKKKFRVINLYNNIKNTNPEWQSKKVTATICEKLNDEFSNEEGNESAISIKTVERYLTEARRDKEIDC